MWIVEVDSDKWWSQSTKTAQKNQTFTMGVSHIMGYTWYTSNWPFRRSRGAYVQTNLHGFTNKHQGFAKEILPPKDPVPEIPRTLEMAGKLADSLPETDICFWLFGVCECLWSIDIVRVGCWWYSLQTNMDGTGKLWVENKDHGLSSASLVFDDHIYI